MITKLYIFETDGWRELPVYNRYEFDERLDEQLDTGGIQTISESDIPFEDFSLYKTVTDDTEGSRELFFYGFDTVEARGEGYHVHTLELVELTRLCMGVLVDGRKVTQPIDESSKQTLFKTFTQLLSIVKTLRYPIDDTEIPFLNGNDEDVSELLKATVSPELHWNLGTSVWESLCDTGNVINCIPRVVVEIVSNTARLAVKFVKINEVTGVYEL